MPQIRPTKFTDFNDQPLFNGYVYVYKVDGSYLDASALLTLTDADTGAAISNPFRTNEFGYPIDTNSQSVNPIFAEEEWAVRIESLQNVEVKTFPKMIADNFNEDVAQTSVVDATFADLPDAKAANLTAYNTVYVQNETAGWEGTLTGPTTGFYAHKDGSTGTPSTGTSAQFFDSAGNGWTRDDLQRIDEQEIDDLQSSDIWEFISSVETTAVANIDLDMDSSTFRDFKLVFEVGVDANADFYFRLGHTGGTVFYSGATDYGYIRTTLATPNRHDDPEVKTGLNVGSSNKISGEIQVYGAGSTSVPTRFKSFYSFNTGTQSEFCDISGRLDALTPAVDAIRLLWGGSNNFDAGDTIKLYGIRA